MTSRERAISYLLENHPHYPVLGAGVECSTVHGNWRFRSNGFGQVHFSNGKDRPINEVEFTYRKFNMLPTEH